MKLLNTKISGSADSHQVKHLMTLWELAKTCKFCNNDCLQNNLHDLIVEGIIDTDAVQELLKEHSLMLEKVIHTCRAMEAGKRELRSRKGASTLATDGSLSESVNAVNLDCASSDSFCAISRYKQSKGKRQSTPVSHPGSCRCCGLAKHHDGRHASCRAFKSVCSNCGKIGHCHAVCLQKPKFSSPPAGHD